MRTLKFFVLFFLVLVSGLSAATTDRIPVPLEKGQGLLVGLRALHLQGKLDNLDDGKFGPGGNPANLIAGVVHKNGEAIWPEDHRRLRNGDVFLPIKTKANPAEARGFLAVCNAIGPARSESLPEIGIPSATPAAAVPMAQPVQVAANGKDDAVACGMISILLREGETAGVTGPAATAPARFYSQEGTPERTVARFLVVDRVDKYEFLVFGRRGQRTISVPPPEGCARGIPLRVLAKKE